MITTLPGLYLSSIGIYQPMSRLFGFSMKLACSTFWLRSINVIFAVGNTLVIKFLLRAIHKKDHVRVLKSITILFYKVNLLTNHGREIKYFEHICNSFLHFLKVGVVDMLPACPCISEI